MRNFPRGERIALTTLFFSFGFFVMSLAPRFPDLKANLGITYGTFGTLLGAGTLGAFAALMTMGHVIHKVGTFPVLFGSASVMMVAFTIVSNTSTPLIFLITNIFFGMSWSSYHVAVNAQTLHRQKEYGINAIPFLHGMWTTGAVTTALVAALIADTVDFRLHMNIVAVVTSVVMLSTILRIRDICIPATRVRDEDGAIGITKMIKSFRIDWPLAIAYLSILSVEITVGDWSALFSRDVLGVSKGNSIVPYIFFMTSMIIGRLGFHRFTAGRSELSVIRRFILVGGSFFALFIAVTPLASRVSDSLALATFIVGLVAGGLGSSFLGPYLFAMSAKRSPAPDSIALAEVSATNTALTFFLKLVIAWVAESAGLTVAIVIPGLLFLSVAFYIKSILASPAKSI